MNEKIKELAEQAWPNLPAHWWERQDGEVARCTNKFAELIIQECIDVHIDDYGVDIIGKVLKKHFGVE